MTLLCLLLLLSCGRVWGQSETGGVSSVPTGGGGGESTSPDPIAIAIAHALKGRSNREQRKNIRKHWLIVAAQQAEDLLRTEAFRRIIEFVEKNRDLFADVYGAMRTANAVFDASGRIDKVVSLQVQLVNEFVATGELLAATEHFTEDELRYLTGTLMKLAEDAENDFTLVIQLFRETSDAKLTDLERFEMLELIESRMSGYVKAILQMQRYVNYLNSSRSDISVLSTRTLYIGN